jgi:hypothetical protein
VTDIARDPFRERGARALRWRTRVLGARCEFSSNSRELLSLARDAFAHVPEHRWPRAPRGTLRVRLEHLRDGGAAGHQGMPPKPVLSSGSGLLCGHVDAHNFAIVDPRAASALVQVGDALLAHRRLVRYELIEFAAVTLAARVQELVPLHAGCVGAQGRGVLLLGGSGSGKSTLALHAALAGLDFLAEDSVFVQAATLHATGLSAYIHARPDSLHLLGSHMRRAASASPVIQRRSGARKHEIDLRGGRAPLAARPLRIVAAVVLEARRARGAPRLTPLTAAQLKRALRAEQAFARERAGWAEFETRLLRAGGFSLLRGSPEQGVAALRELLEKQPP